MKSDATADLPESTTVASAAAAPALFERILLGSLKGMKAGHLHLYLPGERQVTLGGEVPGPEATIVVNDSAFFTKSVLYGSVGFGEAYVDGDWDTPDIRRVIEWFILNVRINPQTRGSTQRIAGIGMLKFYNRILHLLRPNSIKMSPKNISEHYDLGNDFYKLWLDPTMTYSGARFSRYDQSLEEAQHAKYDALCQKLKLQPSDRVLEIGCGWGGFSMHAATHYGCHVTGVTISQEQYKEATARVKAAGLQDKIEIRIQDYRLIEGKFDKIASIEMLEAVGDKYLETYFKKCTELLEPHGMLAFQAITVPDCEYDDLRKGTDWIQKHIFPGSLLLSTGRMNQAINRVGDLHLHSMDDAASSYVRTLGEWHKNFNAQLPALKNLGFDERFIRKWNFYLKYCQAAFATRSISVVQACYTKPGNLLLHCDRGLLA
jgi:cyclopropane-fatty-acyl-phospholipid synthase